MTLIQKFFTAILPKSWSDDMRKESRQWRIQCCRCGASKSVWEAGGIRWKASGVKRTLVHCSQCGGFRTASIKRLPAVA